MKIQLVALIGHLATVESAPVPIEAIAIAKSPNVHAPKTGLDLPPDGIGWFKTKEATGKAPTTRVGEASRSLNDAGIGLGPRDKDKEIYARKETVPTEAVGLELPPKARLDLTTRARLEASRSLNDAGIGLGPQGTEAELYVRKATEPTEAVGLELPTKTRLDLTTRAGLDLPPKARLDLQPYYPYGIGKVGTGPNPTIGNDVPPKARLDLPPNDIGLAKATAARLLNDAGIGLAPQGTTIDGAGLEKAKKATKIYLPPETIGLASGPTETVGENVRLGETARVAKTVRALETARAGETVPLGEAARVDETAH